MMTGLFGYIVLNLMRIICIRGVCVAFVQFNIYAEIIFLGSLLFIIYSYIYRYHHHVNCILGMILWIVWVGIFLEPTMKSVYDSLLLL